MTWREVPRIAWAMLFSGVTLGMFAAGVALAISPTFTGAMLGLCAAMLSGIAAIYFLAGVSRETNPLTDPGESR